MVVGYGSHKAEVLEYISQYGYELSYYKEPSGDPFLDMAELLIEFRKHKDIKSLVVMREDELGSETEYYYWLYDLSLLGMNIIPIESIYDPDLERFVRTQASFRLSVRNKRKNKAMERSRREADKTKFAKYRLPYAYEWVDGKITIDPKKAKKVCFVYEQKKKGILLTEIAKMMNKKDWRTDSGGKWTRDKIKFWLDHHKMFYYGYERNEFGEWEKTHDAIIPDGYLEE